MDIESCGGVVPFGVKDWVRWVFLGEEREAPELGTVGFTPTIEEDGGVLRENGNCGLFKEGLYSHGHKV